MNKLYAKKCKLYAGTAKKEILCYIIRGIAQNFIINLEGSLREEKMRNNVVGTMMFTFFIDMAK